VLVTHAGVCEGAEGSGGPVWAGRSGAESIYLGLLLLAFEVGVFVWDVDIVVHRMMGMLWIEDGFGG